MEDTLLRKDEITVLESFVISAFVLIFLGKLMCLHCGFSLLVSKMFYSRGKVDFHVTNERIFGLSE